MSVEFHVFTVINATTMKEARGRNKLFQNASLLMCYCIFAIGQFLDLKNQSERLAIELLLLKVQISPDQPSGNAFFVPNRWEFFIRLSCQILRAEVPTNR